MRRAFFTALCLQALLSCHASAQEVHGAISGTVYDPSGATVAGAKVTARNIDSGVVTESLTNASGLYSVPFLAPGIYAVTFKKSGFEQYVREGIALHTSERLGIDATLVLGAFSDRVSVAGAVTELQPSTATRQTTTENLLLENMPSGGRNLFALQYDQPGVVKTNTYWGSMELYAFGNVNAVSIGGGRSGENETVLDGLTDSKSDRGVDFIPSLAAVQEFTVQTNNYDAQFGRLGGGATLISLSPVRIPSTANSMSSSRMTSCAPMTGWPIKTATHARPSRTILMVLKWMARFASHACGTGGTGCFSCSPSKACGNMTPVGQ